jgi:putative transposase
MSSHVFHEVYLHLNWHVKNSQPHLTESIEPAVHDFLKDRCRKTDGVYLHGIGGTETHIHLAINIEPQVCISDLIGDLKGSCAHEINQTARMKRLEWQRGFGVVSFGKKQLPWVLNYIARQKQHHACGSFQDRLEKVRFDDDGRSLDS